MAVARTVTNCTPKRHGLDTQGLHHLASREPTAPRCGGSFRFPSAHILLTTMSKNPTFSRRSLLQALAGAPLLPLSSAFAGVGAGIAVTGCGGGSGTTAGAAVVNFSSVSFS